MVKVFLPGVDFACEGLQILKILIRWERYVKKYTDHVKRKAVLISWIFLMY